MPHSSGQSFSSYRRYPFPCEREGKGIARLADLFPNIYLHYFEGRGDIWFEPRRLEPLHSDRRKGSDAGFLRRYEGSSESLMTPDTHTYPQTMKYLRAMDFLCPCMTQSQLSKKILSPVSIQIWLPTHEFTWRKKIEWVMGPLEKMGGKERGFGRILFSWGMNNYWGIGGLGMWIEKPCFYFFTTSFLYNGLSTYTLCTDTVCWMFRKEWQWLRWFVIYLQITWIVNKTHAFFEKKKLSPRPSATGPPIFILQSYKIYIKCKWQLWTYKQSHILTKNVHLSGGWTWTEGCSPVSFGFICFF